MKRMQRIASLIFVLCAFALPAMAQRDKGKQRQWTYTGSDTEGRMTIIITERQIGEALRYQVSGDYKSAFPCTISGTYYPAGKRLKAECLGSGHRPLEITGKLQAEDSFRVDIDGHRFINADRVGEGPPLPTGGLTGSWSIVQTAANGGRYTGMLEIKQTESQLTGRAVWDNHQSGEIKGTVQGKSVKFSIIYAGGLVGTYEAQCDNTNMLLFGGKAYSNKGGGTVQWAASRRHTN